MLRTFFLSFFLLLTACSNAPPPVEVPSQGKPALWKVSSNKGSVWLFGTVHLLPPNTDWQTEAFDRAVRDADMLVLEASGLDDTQAVAAVFSQLGLSPGMPTLASRVDPKLHPVLDRLDEDVPGPRKVLDHLESWAAALTLASVMSADMGLEQSSGVEQILTLRFNADGKAINGLETISQQLGYFDQLSESDQRAMLNAILRGADKNQETFKTLLATWMRGDVDALLDDGPDSVLATPSIKEALLDRRNRDWANQIGVMLDQGKSAFVAVGAGHMGGKGGVPALLMAKGYKVDRVQ
jgi:uncharacterized protein